MTALHEHHCAVCGCPCHSPEAEAQRTVFWDPDARAVLCSDHSDIVDAGKAKLPKRGLPVHPRLAPKWRFQE